MPDILSRPYAPVDLAACLALFDSNVPTYFAPSERAEFEAFLRGLDQASGPYLVLTCHGQIVACGGVLADDQQTASFAWGMVDRALHRQGLGRQRARLRLAQARRMPGITRLRLSTSQHSAGFYEAMGFATTSVTPDGLAPGVDRHDMVMRLD